MTEIKYLAKVDINQTNCKSLAVFNSMRIYSDGTNKYVIFKIHNKFRQGITKISFSLAQYDKDNKLLKRDLISLDNFYFRKKSNLVYRHLTKVHVNTSRVEIEVLKIEFINLIFDNGFIYGVDKRSNKSPKEKTKPAKIDHSFLKLKIQNGVVTVAAVIFVLGIIALILYIFEQVIFTDIIQNF